MEHGTVTVDKPIKLCFHNLLHSQAIFILFEFGSQDIFTTMFDEVESNIH